MADDIQVFRTLASSLVNSVLSLSKTAFTGLASFIDKPVSPQGFGPGDDNYLLADGSVRDYVYRLETPLASSSLALQRALIKLDTTSNRDLPEASFEAIGQVLTCPNIGWRDKARKVVVVTTDAKFHSDRDPITPDWMPSGVAHMPDWNGECYAPLANFKYTRERNNYPSKEQIAYLFKSKNIIPIFAIAHNHEDDSPVLEIDFWRDFQRNYIGFGAVVALSDNGDNLVGLIETALNDFNHIVTLQKIVDPQNVVRSITTARNGTAQYVNVKPGQTVDFKVALSSSGVVTPDNILLQSPGFGTVTISITPTFPCTDCHGLVGGKAVWDKCDLCGGTNACLGCDGVPFSGLRFDNCRVCGGSNQCIPNCDSPRDRCNVCGGKDLCLGCDGIPNSLAKYDECGVCGGQNACIGCDGAKYGLLTDKCGVCGGKNDCIGCDGLAYLGDAPKKVYDVCGVCGGTDACYCDPSDSAKTQDQCGYCGYPTDTVWNVCVGCDGQAGSGLELDLCGVCGGNNECVSDCDGLPFGIRRDVCGVCGGDGSTCVNFNGTAGRPVRKAKVDSSSAAVVGAAHYTGIIVGIMVSLLLCAALIGAFFWRKQRANPHWAALLQHHAEQEQQEQGATSMSMIESLADNHSVATPPAWEGPAQAL